MYKVILCLSMAAAILLGNARTSYATYLAPGGTVTPEVLGKGGVLPTPTVLATQTINFTDVLGSGANTKTLTGTITEQVVREQATGGGTGKLDFLYQVRVTGVTSTGSGASLALNNVSFANFLGIKAPSNQQLGVDVFQSAQNPTVGFRQGSVSIGSATDSGSLTIGDLGLTKLSDTTYTFIVKTTSTAFDNHGSVSGDGTFTTDRGSYQPLQTPEPTSMLLLGGTGLGFGLMTWRKRRRVAPAN